MESDIFVPNTPIEQFLYDMSLRDFREKKWKGFANKWLGNSSPLMSNMACFEDIEDIVSSRFCRWLESRITSKYTRLQFDELDYVFANGLGMDIVQHPLGKLLLPQMSDSQQLMGYQQPAYLAGELSFNNNCGWFRESTGVLRVSVNQDTVAHMQPKLSSHIRALVVVEKNCIFSKVFTPQFCREQQIAVFCSSNDRLSLGLATLIRKVAQSCELTIGVLADEDVYGLYLFGLLRSGDLMLDMHTNKGLLAAVSWIDFSNSLEKCPVVQFRFSADELRMIRMFYGCNLYKISVSINNIISRVLGRKKWIELEAMAGLGYDEYRGIVAKWLTNLRG